MKLEVNIRSRKTVLFDDIPDGQIMIWHHSSAGDILVQKYCNMLIRLGEPSGKSYSAQNGAYREVTFLEAGDVIRVL